MQLLKFIAVQNHGLNEFKQNAGDTIARLVKRIGVLRTLSNIFGGVISNNWGKVFKSGLTKFCGTRL